MKLAYYKKEDIFDTFFNHRNSLIIQFKNGDISKREFLEGNFDFVQDMKVKPFSKIDSYEKGMYNYQYYNVLAKYYTMLAKDIKKEGKHEKYYIYYLNQGNEYYNEKDRATLQLLRFLDFKNVEAYFIRVESRFLRNKLYEIVLKDYQYAIFHSKSRRLLDIVKKEGVFVEGMKTSLIDEYINQKY